MADLAVRLETIDRGWETVGVDRFRGVLPESLTASSDVWGPRDCSFVLMRDPADAADLTAFAPCEIEVNGNVVWEGRVREAPGQRGDQPQVAVTGEGWQAQLDDDVYERFYVHSALSDWADQRSFIGAALGTGSTQYAAIGVVQADQTGVISIGWPAGTTVPAQVECGVTLDLGPSAAWRSVALTVDAPAGHFSGQQLYVRFHDTDTASSFGAGTETPINAVDLSTIGGPGSPTSISASATTAHRYVTVFVYNSNGTAQAITTDCLLRIRAISVFADPSYLSAGVSALKASQLVTDALTHTPLLSQDRSQIQPTSFNIPDFALQGDQTPRQVIQAANSYHNWRMKLLRDRVPMFAAQASEPIMRAGAWSGFNFQDASLASGDTLCNKVVLRGTGPDGAPQRVVRTASGTLIDRFGFTKAMTQSVQSALTTQALEQLGDIYLATHQKAQLKGSGVAVRGGVRRISDDAPPHPSELLAMTTELLRLDDLIDPNTGEQGRDAVIVAATYTHAAEQTQLQFDNDRASLDALMARLDVVASAGK